MEHIIWVKDASNNVSSYNKEVTVSIVSEYEKNFDLTKWDDRAIDQDLKQKYGDTYAFVEPLTKEEIEKRFEFLVWFSEEQKKGTILTNFSFFTGLSYMGETENVMAERWVNFESQFYDLIYKSNDQALVKFKDYSKISAVFGRPLIKFPSSFDSRAGSFGLTQQNKDNGTFDEKDFL